MPGAGSLDPLLQPRSIAMVGASPDPETIGGLLFANLLGSHFDGVLLPVNPRHPSVLGVLAYPDLAACPVVPDLAVVCVPSALVTDIVARARDLGVGAVCVISAGFAETGADGKAREVALTAAAGPRMRILGPNCTGILTTRFNATFSRTVPPPGGVFLVSQSGAVGLAVLDEADARGLGIGGFASVGNAADLTANDLVAAWGEDPTATAILLYLESIPEPVTFVATARRVGRTVPIIAVRAGGTTAGRRAALSHTAALSGGDRGVDAVLTQAGVIRARSIEELLDIATVLDTSRRFRGRSVAVVTNGGGPGILAADACEADGLIVPELALDTAAQLRRLLPPEAGVTNPVDMIASATAGQYGDTVRLVGSDPGIDAVMALFNTPLITRPADVAAELVAARAVLPDEVPLLAVFTNRGGPPPDLRAAGVPAFTFPEKAARALARAVAWAEWCRRATRDEPMPARDRARAERVVARAGDGWLSAADSDELLASFGVPTARSVLVCSPEDAAAALEQLGGPVVVKAAASIHKSDVGGVETGVRTRRAAAAAVRSIRRRLRSAGVGDAAHQLLVQEEIEGGVEMLVGVDRDPRLGALVVVGLGGRLVELLDDVAVRLAPLTASDVEDMVSSLKGARVLGGYRGTKPVDVGAFCALVRRVSAIATELPAVAELDLNPVFVRESGAVVADARIRLATGE